ncbi:hypothetical protein HG531_007255 [Fusarium graminearum]|nr:hypothetical protein HG531_007255 [Fusarium graminearum]
MGLAHDLLDNAVLASFFAGSGGSGYFDLFREAGTLPVLGKASVAIIKKEIPLSVEGLPAKWVALEIRTGAPEESLTLRIVFHAARLFSVNVPELSISEVRPKFKVPRLGDGLGKGFVATILVWTPIFCRPSKMLENVDVPPLLPRRVFWIAFSVLDTTGARLPLLLLVISNASILALDNLLNICVKPAAVHRLVAHNLKISSDLFQVEEFNVGHGSLDRDGTSRLESVGCDIGESWDIQFLHVAVGVNHKVVVDSMNTVEHEFFDFGLGDSHHTAHLDILLVLDGKLSKGAGDDIALANLLQGIEEQVKLLYGTVFSGSGVPYREFAVDRL